MQTATQPSSTAQKQYVLISFTGSASSEPAHTPACGDSGRWRFVLGRREGGVVLDVEDTEQNIRGERLDLLAVIRGLEAIGQPSNVMLFTSSRSVQRGLRYGLDAWRRSAWRWERFGRMVPIKNGDLWQRLDQALKYHSLECRYWCFDDQHEPSQSCVQQEAA